MKSLIMKNSFSEHISLTISKNIQKLAIRKEIEYEQEEKTETILNIKRDEDKNSLIRDLQPSNMPSGYVFATLHDCKSTINISNKEKYNFVFDERKIGKSLIDSAECISTIVGIISDLVSPENIIAKALFKVIGKE